MNRDPDQFWGKRDPDALFDKHPVRPAPFPRASRRKDIQDYDKSLVKSVLQRKPELVDVDPRTIHATQPQVTRAGVSHYMQNSDWETGGQTFHDNESVGNHYPLVYDREDGQRLLLSGHHRATTALLNGKTFKARQVSGPWGPPR